MSTGSVPTHYDDDRRYFWVNSAHRMDPEGDRFIGRFHVAVKTGPQKYSVQKNDDSGISHHFGGTEYGTEVTRAYSRSEAEEAVRRADTKLEALRNDDQLELNL